MRSIIPDHKTFLAGKDFPFYCCPTCILNSESAPSLSLFRIQIAVIKTQIVEITSAYKIVVGDREGTVPLLRPRLRWGTIIKQTTK
jgi:hypothetical protein